MEFVFIKIVYVILFYLSLSAILIQNCIELFDFEYSKLPSKKQFGLLNNKVGIASQKQV